VCSNIDTTALLMCGVLTAGPAAISLPLELSNWPSNSLSASIGPGLLTKLRACMGLISRSLVVSKDAGWIIRTRAMIYLARGSGSNDAIRLSSRACGAWEGVHPVVNYGALSFSSVSFLFSPSITPRCVFFVCASLAQ